MDFLLKAQIVLLQLSPDLSVTPRRQVMSATISKAPSCPMVTSRLSVDVDSP